MGDIDLSEKARREEQQRLNSGAKTREELAALHGDVWDTDEMQAAFTVEGFLAPYVGVIRKSDGKKGLLAFQHHPRFYFGFQPR